MGDNADQALYWNEIAGAKWVANQARLDRVFAPLTRALIAAAAPKPGEHVLDVGCGCGETSLIVAATVGATGAVTAIDLSKPMLDHAAGRGSEADAASIRWLQADAMTHAFEPDADLLISRFGVMFFSDPLAALSNLRTAARPGGRFVFITWRARAEVEWMQMPLDAVAPIVPSGEPTMGEPGPFGFADADATKAIMIAAGLSSVAVAPIDADLIIGAGADPIDDAIRLLLDTGPVAALIREAEPAARRRAESLLRTALATRVVDGAVRLGGACWLYSGCVGQASTEGR